MKNIVKKAEDFVMSNGSDFQKACLQFVLGTGSKDHVATMMRKYQNNDGGWANGLEIEYQGPISSPFTTAAALGHIHRFELGDTDALKNTINYLKDTQHSNGMWDDIEEIDNYPHPEFMGPNVYIEYKTGMIIKWLLRLNVVEKELINKGIDYLLQSFNEISDGNDFWSAVAYASAFATLTEIENYSEIMSWSMSVLAPQENELGWQQVSGMIEDDMPIPEHIFDMAINIIKEHQEKDGGWPNPFGLYNRVWSTIFICRFLKMQKLI